ncbi:nucleotidyltransferase domain-containing protein [Planomonospora venezuelensis]|uniref:Putative nucleotidyltransferase n=1 Tax=Planomonospora venezuelensis TaxID=1999 RepID=A0A841D9U4_PLAVE|nr:nucleotidyltransferase domain-containing protein [Planomonospora venezuelensis]MBB5966961.1 putative nucleotidyltransferase [Planomonospora venezuelensis]GIN01570.1 DNA polymerase subunit beta [Planomonospora venezuelensis]
MDPHRELAAEVAGELGARDDVLAVLIGGSVARGEHLAASDVDLLVVTGEQTSLPVSRRTVRGGLLVEWIARTEDAWLARFDRPRTSWLFAFLEGEVMYDSGPAERLAAQARVVLETYRTSAELRQNLASLLWHGQAKLDRAARLDDAREQGFWASVFTETVIDALFAIHDVPRAAGSRRMAYLHRVPLSASEKRLLDTLLTARASERFRALRRLVAHVRAELGEPDLELP